MKNLGFRLACLVLLLGASYAHAQVCGSNVQWVPCGCGALLPEPTQGDSWAFQSVQVNCCSGMVTGWAPTSNMCSSILKNNPGSLKILKGIAADRDLFVADCNGVYLPFARGSDLNAALKPTALKPEEFELNLRRRVPLS